jgi:hypothetical protein
MSNPKNGEKIPALIVFGRIHGSNLNQAAVFVEKDAEAAKKAASDAGLSSQEVTTEEQRRAAAALPEGVINAQGRFSRSPASPGIVAELDRLLKAATGHAGTSNINAKSETASATITADLWRQLKPGSLVLAAGFDEQDNLAGWWEAIIVRVDNDKFLVRWRDSPDEPRVSRSPEYVALLHPSPALNSSEYEHNHQGRCWETMPLPNENLIECRLAEMGL